MKILKIEKIDGIYNVTFQKRTLFKGIKKFTEQFKSGMQTYMFASSGLYIRPDGTQLKNGHWIARAIDKWERSFS